MRSHTTKKTNAVYFIVVGFLLFSLTSCEEPIASPVELLESRLVISSTFAPNRIVKVRLSATQPATGELQIADISTASVRLFEGPELMEILTYTPAASAEEPGAYETTEFQPLVGHQYTLLVNVDGLTPVTAESAIPLSVPISELRVDNLTESLISGQTIYDYDLLIDYADPAEETNFYDLRISQEVIPFRVGSHGDTTFLNLIQKTVYEPGDPVLNVSSRLGEASFLLKDKPDAGVRIHLQSRFNPATEIPGDLVAELRTVVEPYYQFQRTSQRSIGSPLGGAARPPVNSYTNVQAGYGLFAGYSFTRFTHSWR